MTNFAEFSVWIGLTYFIKNLIQLFFRNYL
jgi:hypothetical protein